MSRNSLIGGGLFLAALLVASVVVALLEDEESFAEGSVEEAVQVYLKAVEDDDFETAYGSLSSKLKDECPIDEFAGGNIPTRSDLGDDRVTLEKTTTVKETVFVTVRVTRIRGSGPFRDLRVVVRAAVLPPARGWRLAVHRVPVALLPMRAVQA